MEVHISFQPEVLFNIFSQEITNSIYTALVVLVPLMFLLVYLKYTFNPFKPGNLELFLEMVYEGLYNLVYNIMGDKYTKKYFSFLLTFFVFILASNWFPLLPGISSLGIVGEDEHKEEANVEYASGGELTAAIDYEVLETESETLPVVEEEQDENFGCLFQGKCYLTTSGIAGGSFKHLFRAPTADLSAGMVLALISVVITNLVGFRVNKFAYLGKYINFHGPINFFVGILEFVSELGKLISFSFRLFGNVFAGEVLLLVVTSISYGVATLPFLGLELFVGLIQALVFFMLTAVFMNLAIQHHHS